MKTRLTAMILSLAAASLVAADGPEEALFAADGHGSPHGDGQKTLGPVGKATLDKRGFGAVLALALSLGRHHGFTHWN